ncbi:hypothetical protein RF11_13309 [Thelohanellus kitauei]|uniref:Uncharacterized protein n=1 Tax=Thelohanellus kitauei TaxID=669202 RepID=A0A0C2NK22_THEKT|nr:hypothetical protein RF11_13309 [Thelohanellus kitauei]
MEVNKNLKLGEHSDPQLLENTNRRRTYKSVSNECFQHIVNAISHNSSISAVSQMFAFKISAGGNLAKLFDSDEESILCDIVEEDCSLTLQNFSNRFYNITNKRISQHAEFEKGFETISMNSTKRRHLTWTEAERTSSKIEKLLIYEKSQVESLNRDVGVLKWPGQ